MARRLLDHANSPEVEKAGKDLRDDILRSAWMFAVGALDAYFSDMYVHSLTLLLRASQEQAGLGLQTALVGVSVHAAFLLEEYMSRPNWRWRNFARSTMERNSMLKLDDIAKPFNKFIERDQDKLFGFVSDDFYKDRLQQFVTRGTHSTNPARGGHLSLFKKRLRDIIQRRHDCIHNCDRPKTRRQRIATVSQVERVVEDVKYVVESSDSHINTQLEGFLRAKGCNRVTMNRLGF